MEEKIKKKSNLMVELKDHGYQEAESFYGSRVFKKEYSSGKRYPLFVEIRFTPDEAWLKAMYRLDKPAGRPFKEKMHANDRRALNAIKATVINKGYQW